jgi:hypothetical protein
MKSLDCFALHLNNYRVIPRLVILWLLHITWSAHTWAQHLTRPLTLEDVSYVGLFTGLFVTAFAFYLKTGGFQSTGDKLP